MVVQEGHKKVAGVTMRAEDVFLYLLALLVRIADPLRGKQALTRTGKLIKEWIVERGINTDGVTLLRVQGIATNKVGDGLLAVPDFAVGEKVLFTDALGKLTYAVGKRTSESGAEVFQGIDTKGVDVVFGDEILESANENVVYRVASSVLVVRIKPLERVKIAGNVDDLARVAKGVALASKEGVRAELLRPDGSIERRVSGRLSPILPGVAFLVAPVDRVGLVAPGGQRAVVLIGKHVAGVMKYDVQDDIDTASVGFVYELA